MSYLIKNPEYRFSHERAHMLCNSVAEPDLQHNELEELNDEPPLKRIKVESSEDVPDDQEILINSYLQVILVS